MGILDIWKNIKAERKAKAYIRMRYDYAVKLAGDDPVKQAEYGVEPLDFMKWPKPREPSRSQECQHQWVRDEDSPAHLCCQKCQAVKSDS